VTAADRRLGPYRLVERLGAGAMGEVWRAVDTRLDRAVAVKVLPPKLAADPDRRARMLKEAKAAAAVPHPNVVALFDVGTDEGEDYLVMELVEGRTIARILEDGPLPLERALEVGLGVADALAAAHKKGILHRDVKAANIIVPNAGGVKVLDFGLARLRAQAQAGTTPVVAARDARQRVSGSLDATLPSEGGSHDATREGTLLGTPAYFAPEQVEGRLPDEKSEIFSVGVLVYEMVAGKNPFHAGSFDDLFARILRCEPEPLEAPEPVRRPVMRALSLEPEDRHPDMASLAAELRAAHDALFVPKRARWPWAAGAGVLAAAVAGLIVFFATRTPALSAADKKIEQAIAEYDVFYNDQAASSLRAAMRLDPDDPRPYAYLVLMGYASDDELLGAAAEAEKRLGKARRRRDRALVSAATTLLREGPAVARERLGGAGNDRELAFWDAELAWRAGQFDVALAGYEALLASDAKRFRGRIFDHVVACLLYRDRIDEAVKIGEAYAREYPGEADAIGVKATVYAVAGRLDDALTLAREARQLSQNEDTLAGLAKVHTLRGELQEAERLYKKSVDDAPDYRRPLRRAALGMIYLMNNRVDDARAALAPCLPGGPDADERTSTVCWFVAGLADNARIPVLVPELRARAAVKPPRVPYGRPDSLASILESIVALGEDDELTAEEAAAALKLLEGADDLYVVYHLPFLSSYVPRLRAQIHTMRGDFPRAIAALEPSLEVRPADVQALLQLAGAQAGIGKRDAALSTLDRIDQLWRSADPDSFVRARSADLRRRLSTL
jgi:tetratricopeptide (TPR) repeat protein/tRNA A-37 threonylcarbamoyl transferase component Bud32